MKMRDRRGREASRRERIFRRDRYRCVYCGFVGGIDELTLDHVEPRVKGGDGSDGNLVTCCGPCNASKGGLPAWSFLACRPEERANFLRLAIAVWPRLRCAVLDAAQSGGVASR